MENKQAVECQNAQMGYFCFFRYFFRRGNLFFDKIIKNILTKQKSYDILNYVATALCNINTMVFQRFALTGDTRKRKPFMCDNMYTECEKRKQNIPTITGTFCFLYCPFALCNSHLLYPSSPIYSTNLIIVVHR